MRRSLIGQELTVVTETPLLLSRRYAARMCRGLTGAVDVTHGPRPLNQVAAGERLGGGLKLSERNTTEDSG